MMFCVDFRLAHYKGDIIVKSKTFQFTTVVTIFILLGFLNQSDAKSITSIGPRDGSYHAVIYNQIIYHTARVVTDEPFYCVWWYVDDEYVSYSDGSNVKLKPILVLHICQDTSQVQITRSKQKLASLRITVIH